MKQYIIIALISAACCSTASLTCAHRCAAKTCRTKPYQPVLVSPEPQALGYPYGADWTPCGCYQLCRFRDGWPMPIGCWGCTNDRC